MCCTTTKTKRNIDLSKTKIYTIGEMFEEEEKKEGSKALFFEYGSLKFCIIFTKEYFTGVSHLAFHAMSRGLEAYTETGYKSNFAHAGAEIGDEDVEEYIKAQIMKEGIDLDNPKPCMLSQVGGVAKVTQPALFY